MTRTTQGVNGPSRHIMPAMEPTPHPRNTSFAWTAPPGPPRLITPAQAASWNDSGFFLLEQAFDPAPLLTAIDPFEERTTAWLRKQEGGRVAISDAEAITFTVHLVKRSDTLRDFVKGPLFQGLAHDLVGSDVRLYWDQAVYKKPEPVREFPWHQDNGYTYIEPQQYLTCWCALTDATVGNGCPVVVPGLHRMGTLKHWMTPYGWQCVDDPTETVAVPAPAGSIVVFSSLTPHKTGANTTGATRKAYIVQFAPDGARVVTDDGATPCDDPDRQFPVLRDGAPA